MKVGLNQKNAISTATLGVAAAGGSMVSKGAMSFAPASMKKPILKGILGIAGLIAASTIQGKDTADVVARGVLLGAGVQQSLEAVAGIVKPKLAVAENPSGMQKFLNASVDGLAGSESSDYQLPDGAWADFEEQAQPSTVTFAAV